MEIKTPQDLRNLPSITAKDITPEWVIKNIPSGIESSRAPMVRPLLDSASDQEIGKAMQVGGKMYQFDQGAMDAINEVVSRTPQQDGFDVPDTDFGNMDDMMKAEVKPLMLRGVDDGPTAPVADETDPAIKVDTKNIKAPKLQLPELDGEDILNSEVINIDGTFTPQETMSNNFAAAIKAGDSNSALAALDTILKAQDVADRFRRDLTPEAMNADLLRGFQSRRQGREPAMTLTKSGEFRGEKRSPEEIEKGGQRDVINALTKFASGSKGRADTKNQMTRISADIVNAKERLDVATRRFKMESNENRRKRIREEINDIVKGATARFKAANDLYSIVPERDKEKYQQSYEDARKAFVELNEVL
jgi:hypothetical protein